MRFAFKTGLAAALVLGLALTGFAHAAQKKPDAQKKPVAQEKPVVEERAAQIFEKTCKALSALKAYSFRADVTLDKVYQDGSKIQAGRQMDVAVQRPNSFRVTTNGDEFQAVSVFNGKLITIALPGRKAYGQIGAVMDTDALMDMLATNYGIESPLGDLLSNTPCANMKPMAGFYVGKAMVGGVACDHLFFQGKDVDWQIWVEEAQAGLPRKVVITEKKLAKAPQFTAVLTNWKIADNAPETFEYAVPADYTRDDGIITGAATTAVSGK